MFKGKGHTSVPVPRRTGIGGTRDQTTYFSGRENIGAAIYLGEST